MTTPPGNAAVPPAGRRGGFGRWVSTHKPEAAAGAGVGLVLVVVIVKKMRASSAAAAANNAQSTTGSTPAGAASYYDPSGDYNSLEQQIASLQTAMAAQTVAPVSTTPAPGSSTTSTTPAATTASPFALGGLKGMTLAQALAAVKAAGGSVATVSYAYKNLDPTQWGNFSADTIAHSNPVGANQVAIGLN